MTTKSQHIFTLKERLENIGKPDGFIDGGNNKPTVEPKFDEEEFIAT